MDPQVYFALSLQSGLQEMCSRGVKERVVREMGSCNVCEKNCVSDAI